MDLNTKSPLQIAAEKEARPNVIRQASADYSKLGLHMQDLVDDFNEIDSEGKRLGISLELQGPEMLPDSTFYLLRLKSKEATLAWKSLQIQLPNVSLELFSNFYKVRVGIEKWSYHYKLDALKNGLSGHAPGREPKRFEKRQYRLEQVDKAYGWLIENSRESNVISFNDLFESLVQTLMKENLK